MTDHNVKEVEISDIYVGDNSRIEIKKEDLSELMDSIKQQGLLQAIGVVKLSKTQRGRGYKIVYGNRRLVAFKKLRKKFIPARIITDAKEQGDHIILNLIENDQRKNIDSFEFGRSCVYLLEKLDYSMKEMAIALSTNISRIQSCIDIYRELPHEFSGKIKTMPYGKGRDGNIPSSLAKTVIQMKRRYNLKKDQITQVLNLISRDDTLTGRTLNHVMFFMSQGLDLKTSLRKVRNVLIKRYELAFDKKQADALVTRYGSLSEAINHALYSSGEIVDPRETIRKKEK